MESNKIPVNNQGIGIEDVFAEVEKFSEYQSLNQKETLRLRLLAEEMMGLVRGIVGGFEAYFWLAGEKKNISLHLEAYTSMDIDKRDELLAMATSGKNMAARGFMGKVRDMFETYLLSSDALNQYAVNNGINLFPYGEMDMMTAGMDWGTNFWSLERYRSDVEGHRQEASAAEAWDELEKSIVARLADDVLVGIRSDKVELIIKKKF